MLSYQRNILDRYRIFLWRILQNRDQHWLFVILYYFVFAFFQWNRQNCFEDKLGTWEVKFGVNWYYSVIWLWRNTSQRSFCQVFSFLFKQLSQIQILYSFKFFKAMDEIKKKNNLYLHTILTKQLYFNAKFIQLSNLNIFAKLWYIVTF